MSQKRVKLTYTLDEETANYLREYSQKYNRPISELTRLLVNSFVSNLKTIRFLDETKGGYTWQENTFERII